MKNIMYAVGVASLATGLLTGCSSDSSSPTSASSNNTPSPSTDTSQVSSQKADAEQLIKDVKPYVNEVWDVRHQFNADIDKSKANNLTDAQFSQDLTDMAKKVTDAHDHLINLNNEPADTQKIQQSLLDSVNGIDNGLLDFEAAIQQSDTSKIADGNTYVQKSDDALKQAINDLGSMGADTTSIDGSTSSSSSSSS